MEQHSILTHNKLSSDTESNLEAGDVTGVLSGICFCATFHPAKTKDWQDVREP